MKSELTKEEKLNGDRASRIKQCLPGLVHWIMWFIGTSLLFEFIMNLIVS